MSESPAPRPLPLPAESSDRWQVWAALPDGMPPARANLVVNSVLE
jgi:hypothetical protein